MSYFLIDKRTRRVKSISDGLIDYDKEMFDLKKIIIKETEQGRIDSNDIIYYKNNKFEFKKHRSILAKGKMEDIKNKLKNANSVSALKEIINTLIQ
jgi:hypothetical protein